MTIGNVVKSIRDIMRKDAGVDGDAQRISQMVWMIFLKVFDAMEEEREAEDESYKSPLPEKIRWRNWAKDPEGMTGEELLDFVNNKLFKTLKNLPLDEKTDKRGFIVKQVFEDAYNYMKNGILVRQVVNKINELDFTTAEDRHLFNDIYETILKELQSAGSAGEFYTPRPVTQFIVDMVDPKLGDIVLDPACGTGGFLVSTLNHLKKDIKTIEDQKLLEKTLRGIEKKPLPHLLCMTNLILHDIEVPNIRHDNSLARPLIDYTDKDKVNVVVTNPPFGGAEEEGIENNFPAEFRTRETADLFLILITKLLRDGGKCGIVLPDPFLSDSGVKTRIKEKLMTDCNLHTIIRLPKGVFSPYTGINTNLLFFEKGKKTKEVWYFEHPLPDGYKTYSKTKPVRYEEFKPEKEWWNDRENEKFKQYCWKVSIQEIRDKNYNLDIKNTNFIASDFADPQKMLEDYKTKSSEILANRELLKEKLKRVLGSVNSNINLALDNFDILFDTDEKISRFIDLLLKLAITGRLGSFNKEKDLASEIIKKIKTEKLIVDKKLSPIIKEPYKLPERWQWTKLGEIIDLEYGKGIPKDICKDKGKYPVFGANGIMRYSSNYLVEGPVIIVGRKGSAGALNISGASCWPADVTYFVKPVKHLDFKFVFYLLKSLSLEKLARGIKPGLNRNEAYDLLIALPPYSEQKIIVKKIDELLNLSKDLKKQVKENQENSEKLMESVLRESFEE